MEQTRAVLFHNAYINADDKELDRLWQEAPKTLIKFYPAKYELDESNYFIEHLLTRKLWLSSPAFFNDPFDSVINYDYRNQTEQWCRSIFLSHVGEIAAQEIINKEYMRELIDKAIERFEQDIKKVHKRFEERIYTVCFSEKDNLTSLRMWGHYANNHEGVCAEYDFCDINQATAFGCIPIRYTNDYEYIINAEGIREGVFNFLKLYTKSTEWQYEKEWRVSQLQENHKGKGYTIEFVQPKKVYLGCKVKSRLKNDIIQQCENQGIGLYQMRMRPGSYCLEIANI